MRVSEARIDLNAVRHNVRVLRDVAGSARLCAVVKADAYGHGAVRVAEAAVQAGADWLAVALTEEGMQLRRAGLRCPILVLSEPSADDIGQALTARVEPTLYTREGIEAAAAIVRSAETRPLRVHLKIDTGMRRVGADPVEAVDLAGRIVSAPELELASVWTHLAVADEPENAFTVEQLRRFSAVLEQLRDAGIEVPLVHAANSAGLLAHESARLDLVRTGVALYGLTPSPALAACSGLLRPALSLLSTVTFVKQVKAGEGISYGLRHRVARDTTIATIPLGYADGVARRLAETGGEVLIGGRRRPIVGAITMDQLMVDCGHESGKRVRRGDPVVLIGRQGDEEITAWEWAERLGTIAYEVVCAIGPRVRRSYVG